VFFLCAGAMVAWLLVAVGSRRWPAAQPGRARATAH